MIICFPLSLWQNANLMEIGTAQSTSILDILEDNNFKYNSL
jgi:hypothetical protein